jgi:hypothetical protein
MGKVPTVEMDTLVPKLLEFFMVHLPEDRQVKFHNIKIAGGEEIKEKQQVKRVMVAGLVF